MAAQTLNINRIINLFYKITNKHKFFKYKLYNKFIKNKKRYPNITKYLDNVFIDSDSYIETLYRLINNILDKPKCPICNKKISFTNKTHMFFPKTCSSKCAHLYSAKKSKEKCLKLYNVDNFAKLESSKKKYKQTCLEKYGVDSVNKTIEHKNKIKQTCLEKYGVTSSLAIKEIHDKGVKSSQSKQIIEKRNKTILKKYGVKNISQNQKIKNKKEQTFIKHFGVKNIFNAEHVKNKCNNQESRQKMYETKCKNNSFNSSKTEIYSYNLLKEKYPDVIYQYKSDLYPFMCDFYIPSLDLYIECNYHWTHGGHPYDENNIEDQNRLELWKSKNTKYYNNAIYTWTILDIKKQQIAFKNKIKYILFYNINELIKWINN